MNGSLEIPVRNMSVDSTNRIHSNEIAQRYGFSGALVPGADVFGYMSRVSVAQWGPDWLRCGKMHARFTKPLYDGKIAHVHWRDTLAGLDLVVESDGVRCAVGTATSPQERAPTRVDPQDARPPAVLPAADRSTLAPGTELHIAPRRIEADAVQEYARGVDDRCEAYFKGIVHPAILLRLCNRLVDENVRVGPWIHTQSDVTNLTLARSDRDYSGLGRVIRNYQRNGNWFVDIDALLLCDGEAVAQVTHVAIYELGAKAPRGPA
jgi:hypothetical protein